MFSNIGITEFVLIFIVGLLLFGPKKLPEIGRAVGKAVQEFKNGARGLLEDAASSSVDRSSTTQTMKSETPSKQEEPIVVDVTKSETPAQSHNPKRLPE
jgi:sec-independent protein translocase protein TatA